MNPIGVDIAALIRTNSSYELGNNLFVNNLPTEPMNVVVVYDTSSTSPDNTLDKQTYWNDAVQVLVRNTNYLTAMSICTDMINILHNRTNEEIGGTQYLFIFLQNGPNKLGSGDIKTGKGENLYSLNFRIKRK